MPKESTNLKLKLYNAVTDAKELAVNWFNNIFDYSNSNWVKIDDAYKELKDKFGNYPEKDGTGATGDWDINITGAAKSATSDESGNNIRETYIKEVNAVDGTLTIKKGDDTSSTFDISSPKGYVLSKEFFLKGQNDVDNLPWLHIGNIKNTSDNDFIKVSVVLYISTKMELEDGKYSYDTAFKDDLFIYDKTQEAPNALNTAYSFLDSSYSIYHFLYQPSTQAVDNNNSSDASAYVIPTSGGNGTSNAELWYQLPPYDAKLLVTVAVAEKDKWEFILEAKDKYTESEFAIQPLEETSIITSQNIATSYGQGIVQIGSGINVNEEGVISVAPATSAYAGGVKSGGENINIDSDGVISVPTASQTTKGVIKVGDGLSITDDGVLSSSIDDNTTSSDGYIISKNLKITLTSEDGSSARNIHIADVQKTTDSNVVKISITANHIQWLATSGWKQQVDYVETTDLYIIDEVYSEESESLHHPIILKRFYNNALSKMGTSIFDTDWDLANTNSNDDIVVHNAVDSDGNPIIGKYEIWYYSHFLLSNTGETLEINVTTSAANKNKVNFVMKEGSRNQWTMQITQIDIGNPATSVNGFKFKSQTTDPGTDSSLDTGPSYLFIAVKR